MSAKIFPAQPMHQEDELEQLKQLLFENELQSVEELRKHLLDPQQRIVDTAEILVESIKMTAANKEADLVAALNDPVDQCIRSIVEHKPQQFADSLFPVMGPAIRKSISETLKSFVQSTNQMIEQSMSLKSLHWRWEARRSGVPFSEIVLKHSLLYRVEEVFLIQQGSGLLIEHVSHPGVVEHDSDAISAMLTVIRDFSRDSFSTTASDSLQTVEFGERTLWMFDGPKAILACVNRGLVPKTNRVELQSVLEQFHSRYSTQLEQFSGDRSQHPEFKVLLETCLRQQTKESASSAEPSSETPFEKFHWLRNKLTWLLLGILLLSAYWLWQNYDQQRRTDALLTELKSIPGLVVIGTEKTADVLLIKGLRDPLAQPLDAFAEKHGFTSDELQFQMALYQSLDPPMALKRAAQLLDTPNTVSLSADGQQLLVLGTATREWLDFADKMRDRIPGFNTLNLDQVTVGDASRLLQIRRQLQAPQTVRLRLDQDTLLVSGAASIAWINNLKQKSTLLQPPLNLITDDRDQQLEANEWLQAVALQQELNGVSLYFSQGITFDKTQQTRMQQQLYKISQLRALLDELKVDVSFVIKGYSDGTGSTAHNQSLNLKRAEAIKQQLIKSGVTPTSIRVEAGQTEIDTDQSDLSLRRADIQVKLFASE
jgi:outer membrane protein OmpA-like peptidoglycan-associated protein